MARVRSELQMVLIDGVSMPAKKVRRALADVDASAKRVKGGLVGAGLLGREGVGLGAGRMMVGGAAAYLGAAGATSMATQTAQWDRKVTRILNTADASAVRAGEVRARVRDIAADVGAPVGQVVDALDALVASGRTLDDALAMLKPVSATAQASGADLADIAKTADAVGTSFDIAASKMDRAFDTMVAAGKLGKFELKDMARYLPSIAPAAAAIGLKGEEGLRKTMVMFQTIRAQTGTSEEAATALSNVFQKMEIEETATKFKKFGIDLRKEMAKARKEGRDLTEVFVDLTLKAVKGDLSKLPQLFGDAQMLTGMRALASQPDLVRRLAAALKQVDGATLKDLATVSSDAQATLDRLSNSWGQLVLTIGKTADAFGASAAIRSITEDLERLSAIVDKARGGDIGGAAKSGLEFLGRNRSDGEIRRGDMAARADELNSLWDRRQRAHSRWRPMAAEYEAIRQNPNRTPEEDRRARLLRPQIDALAKDVGDLDKAISTALKAAQDAAGAYIAGLPQGAKMGGVGGLPPDPASDRMPEPYSMTNPPLPPRKPSAAERVVVPAGIDPGAVDAAALDAAKRTQAILDANRPVIRPVLDMSGVGNPAAQMGRAVTTGVAGGFSDVGAGSAAR